jgi:hypothetical protein
MLDKISETIGNEGDSIDVNIDRARVRITDEIAGRVGGEDAVSIVRDIDRLFAPLTPQHRRAAFEAFIRFLQTGDFQYLQPFATLAAGEIQKARDDNWDAATPIGSDIIGAMPLEIRGLIGHCRYIELSRIPGQLDLPDFAIKHLRKAGAIALIDLVVWEVIPDLSQTMGKHDWAHECHHLRQYADLGVVDFCKRYIGNATGFRAPGHRGREGKIVNPMEEEADVFACHHFWVAQPRYILACP